MTRERDDIARDRVATFRPFGTGLQLSMQCWGCKTPKRQDGGRRLGALRLFHCAECIERKKTEKVAVS